MENKSLEERVKALEKVIESLKLAVERLEAAREIENMMSRYEYYHANNQHRKVMEMYSKDPGTRIYFGELGYWEGPDAPQRAWGILEQAKPQPGELHFHPTMCPIIEVAADGKTAKAVWTTFGFETGLNRETGKLESKYAWGTYGVDLIKEGGKWKFWHFHIYRLLTHEEGKGWTTKEGWDPDFVGMPIPEQFKPDGPAVDDYPYRTDWINVIKPDPPEPYRTWEETTSY